LRSGDVVFLMAIGGACRCRHADDDPKQVNSGPRRYRPTCFAFKGKRNEVKKFFRFANAVNESAKAAEPASSTSVTSNNPPMTFD
jgi:hypothetical protein